MRLLDILDLDRDRVKEIFVSLEAAYRPMAQEEAREAEALEWAEAMVGDVGEQGSLAESCGAFVQVRPARG